MLADHPHQVSPSRTVWDLHNRFGARLADPCMRNNNNNKLAYAGQLNNFTHLRALLVLHDCIILSPVN
jgi:hypothetical protein